MRTRRTKTSRPRAASLPPVLMGCAVAALGLLAGCVTEESNKSRISFDNGQGPGGESSLSTRIHLLERKVESLPERIDLREELSRLYFQAERYDDAIQEATEALKKDPRNARLHNTMGGFYLEMDRYSEAEESFRQVAKYAKPGYTGPRLMLGYVLAMQEKYDQAIEEFETVLKLSPNQPTVLYYLGCCYDVTGDRSKAVAYFEQCAEIEGPYQPKALAELRRLKALSRTTKEKHFKDGKPLAETELDRVD